MAHVSDIPAGSLEQCLAALERNRPAALSHLRQRR